MKVNAPKKEDPKTFITSFFFIVFPTPRIFLTKREIDQKRNTIVKALDVTDIMFTVYAICSLFSASIEKIAPSI